MPRIRSRRSAPAAPIPVWRTPRTWRGNSTACCGHVAGAPARELSHRAQRGGRREHPRIDPLDRFHGAGSRQEARLRKAVLSLAKETEFGKRMVNGGRLSVPSVYDTPLSTADCDAGAAARGPGASMPDAPIAAARHPMFLTEAFIKAGTRFTLLEFGNGAATSDPPDGVATSASAATTVCRFRGSCRRALRRRTRHGLSAAARRLCRRALPAPDAPALDAALARAAGIN
jgi:3-(3-hydroxy-phenyl)propionate hydroxylase